MNSGDVAQNLRPGCGLIEVGALSARSLPTVALVTSCPSLLIRHSRYFLESLMTFLRISSNVPSVSCQRPAHVLCHRQRSAWLPGFP